MTTTHRLKNRRRGLACGRPHPARRAFPSPGRWRDQVFINCRRIASATDRAQRPMFDYHQPGQFVALLTRPRDGGAEIALSAARQRVSKAS